MTSARVLPSKGVEPRLELPVKHAESARLRPRAQQSERSRGLRKIHGVRTWTRVMGSSLSDRPTIPRLFDAEVSLNEG